MKTHFALLLLTVACGDNIRPVDDEFDFTDVATEPDGFGTGETAPDAGTDDAPDAPESCDDSHVELNDHEHKCRHNQELPTP